MVRDERGTSPPCKLRKIIQFGIVLFVAGRFELLLCFLLWLIIMLVVVVVVAAVACCVGLTCSGYGVNWVLGFCC